MAFLTPCFVRVDDPEERKKLIEWLEGIGYIFNDCFIGARDCAVSKYLKQFYVISGDPHVSRMCKALDAKPEYGNYIDAGTNVDLFRALAAMNDENDREQWFVVKKNISDCYDIDDIIYQKGDMFFNASGQPLVEKHFRKATAEEIIEYFKKK